jgi:putative hemolysin
MQLLWQGIADYISENSIEIMFGCASLVGTDIKNIAGPLSYLYHYHLAPPALRPRAVRGRYINMNIVPREDLDHRRLFAALPPLIKGYIRLGGCVGDGAVIDSQFNTTDVCIVVQTHLITSRYRRHYERKIQKSFGDFRSLEDVGDSLPDAD